eukprot:GHVU01152621.1.p1 GENE.GHVU01152621.1~~GHVU01152621.1.p1  ORF type:complete len:129 (-),score=12.23 GHVU01152621.1:83-469(-)
MRLLTRCGWLAYIHTYIRPCRRACVHAATTTGMRMMCPLCFCCFCSADCVLCCSVRALAWLTKETIPGDVLVFYFAGHGVQVDNMSGWEGEGYDEALVPLDLNAVVESDGWGVPNPITAMQIREARIS